MKELRIALLARLKAKVCRKQVLFSVCVVKILLSMLISKALQMLDLTT